MTADPVTGSATLFRNARLLDPASGRDAPGSLLIVDGKIAALGADEAPQAPLTGESIHAEDGRTG